MEIVSSSESQQTAADALSEALRRRASKPILLMCSGGSAMDLLDYVHEEPLGPHITLTVLDERFSPDPRVNNFAQLQNTDFYRRAVSHNVHMLPTLVREGEDMREAARNFAAALSEWRHKHPEGEVLATMGIGSDGHVAGIMPGDYGVDFSGDPWVVSYEVPKSVNPHTKRITPTFTFLRDQVDEALVYAVGDEKKPYLRMLSENCRSNSDMPNRPSLPVCVLRHMHSVRVFTDATAQLA